MKVSYVTLPDFHGALQHISAVARGALFMVGLASCHRAVPVTPAASSLGTPLDAPPIEALWIRLPPTVADVPEVIRQAMHGTGLQASAESRQQQWVRAALGGVWEDPYRYRQWHIVANYGADSTAPGTLVVVRAVEQFTSYLATLGRPANGSATPGSGFTRTHFVSDAAVGDSRAVWVQVEQLALALSDRGGELLTDFARRRKRAP
ncbi:MAG: hypothetical protein ABMA00_03085 [Gemmatimonas sp.]